MRFLRRLFRTRYGRRLDVVRDNLENLYRVDFSDLSDPALHVLSEFDTAAFRVGASYEERRRALLAAATEMRRNA